MEGTYKKLKGIGGDKTKNLACFSKGKKTCQRDKHRLMAI